MLIALLLTSITFCAPAQTVIPAAAAAKHIGETVKIMDKVYSSTAQKNDVLLKVGGSAAHPCLLVVIKLANHSIADDTERTKHTGHEVYVTGKLTKYKGRPAIIITNPIQIRLVMVDRGLQPAFN